MLIVDAEGGYESTIPDEFKILTGKYAWKIDVSKYNIKYGSVTYGIIKYSNDLVITTELEDRFADDKAADTPSANRHSELSVDQQTPSNNTERYSVMDDNTTPNVIVDKALGKCTIDEDITDLVMVDRYSMKRNLKEVYDVDGSSSKLKKASVDEQFGKCKFIIPNVTQDTPLLINVTSSKHKVTGQENMMPYAGVSMLNTISPSIIDKELSNGLNKGKEKVCTFTDIQPKVRIKTNRVSKVNSIGDQQNENHIKSLQSIMVTPYSNITNASNTNVQSTSYRISKIHERISTKRRRNPVGLNIPLFPTNELTSIDDEDFKGISKGISTNLINYDYS
ncbi:hypothetical protein QVD17_31261 [Tagetes erecta]|uniref:Uncharacterized protein n=1 Tax=Tagetes erecta TaxID=13708 RepID=A0AAD8K330_TARER|nr:hypothetical protein QVD17_31261 [Tagetes erecta]